MLPQQCRNHVTPTLRRLLPGLSLLILLGGSGTLCRAQAWSADGHLLALGGPNLLLADVARITGEATNANAASSPITLAGKPTGLVGFPSWSPDDKTVAYLTADHKLMLFDVASQQQTLAHEAVLTPASWTPDSKTFAVVTQKGNGALEARTLYRDGGQALDVDLPFKALPNAWSKALAWVPNTDNVILAGGDGEHNDLYLIEQGQPIRLTTSSDVLGFTVSHDGNTVLWARRSLNAHYILFSLYELTIQSRSLRKLDFPAVLPNVNPRPREAPDAVVTVVFSPDHKRLAFVTRGGAEFGADGDALWVCDVAGHAARLIGRGRLLPVQTPALPFPDTTGLSLPATLPAFSPDGKRLATIQATADQRTLLIADLDTGQTFSTPLP